MKKRVLSILLCLCMVLALCPVTAFAETGGATYSLTLNFKYGTLYGQTGSYVLLSDSGAGDPYDVTHILDDITGYEPYKIVGFRSDTGDGEKGSFSDHDIVLEVVYEVDGSLAITVDGFEAGKTPNDCEYTFDSTIPDITFSERDICGDIEWEKYVVDGTGYSWANVGKTEVFQADTPYRLLLALYSDLELPPAVTVNGITPTTCRIAITNNQPFAIVIFCEFGTPPEPALTIDGPDVVCAQQDYEFSVTASEGVTCTEFTYGDTGKGVLSLKDGVLSGTVPAGAYSDMDSFMLTVTGEAEDNTPVSATKTVQVSSDHIYTDGVCGCGAVQQYTITYDGGEGVEGSIPAGTKTHGEDFTLSSDTFTWDGFVQTGWIDKETGAIYELGATFGEDRDATLYPYWEKLVTLTVPYTTTVALGDVGVPGEKTFTLALIGDSAPDADKSNVTITGSVTTNGKGSYNGTLTFTGPEGTLWHMLSEGAFVQQVDNGEAGWTVDDTVWGLLMTQAAELSDDAAAGYALLVVPASIDGQGNYTIDWENLQTADMTFTNTYTAHAYELKHDTTHHWDECACKDVQNKELHQYGDWTVTKAATETEEGQRERTCTVCGYRQTETIPVLEHTHDYTQKYDKTNHWDECDCGDIQNKEAHKYGEWTVTKKATQTAKGEKEHTCTVCGYTEKAEIAKLGTVGTGDNSNIALWFALFTLSAAAVITTATVSKKKKAEK